MSDQERLYSALDAQKLLGIPASTVRTWASRQSSNLDPYGLDHRGHPMFRGSDLQRLNERRLARGSH